MTITANDSSSELTSCVRRGPFAIPDRPLDHERSGGRKTRLCTLAPFVYLPSQDEDERLQYLLSRKRTLRAPAEKHSVLHVLSYQRRVNTIKQVFFARGSKTPLGHNNASKKLNVRVLSRVWMDAHMRR